MSDVLARDMGRKISGVMKETLKRELAIAQHVLPPAEIIFIMLAVAKGALGSAAATAAGVAPAAEREQLFRATIDAVAEMAREGWDEARQEIASRYAALDGRAS